MEKPILAELLFQIKNYQLYTQYPKNLIKKNEFGENSSSANFIPATISTKLRRRRRHNMATM
jgi:hypothetical protein